MDVIENKWINADKQKPAIYSYNEGWSEPVLAITKGFAFYYIAIWDGINRRWINANSLRESTEFIEVSYWMKLPIAP